MDVAANKVGKAIALPTKPHLIGVPYRFTKRDPIVVPERSLASALCPDFSLIESVDQRSLYRVVWNVIEVR